MLFLRSNLVFLWVVWFSRLLREEIQVSNLATTGRWVVTRRLLRVIASGGDILGEPRNDDRRILATTDFALAVKKVMCRKTLFYAVFRGGGGGGGLKK
ncbi:MAG: hypothetical protein FWG98_14170 [Candidatus Cloacimonetes bacterium]|nr:hypothetical protein [Candidatus Cloacimonadota bacterium]